MKKYLGSTGLLWKLGELKTQTTILYVVEKCVAKLEDELLRICPEGGTITPLSLAVATANLSTRIRNTGLRLTNHPASERSKAPGCCPHPAMPVQVGDLVYLTPDSSKTHSRNRYLVVSVDHLWCNVRKCTGLQLRSTSYRVKLSECYRVSDPTDISSNLSRGYSTICTLKIPRKSLWVR